MAVDVLSIGQGTRVRAPYTAVDTGILQGNYVPAPHVEQYPVPCMKHQAQRHNEVQPTVIAEEYSVRIFLTATTLRRSIFKPLPEQDVCLDDLKADAIMQSLKNGKLAQELVKIL